MRRRTASSVIQGSRHDDELYDHYRIDLKSGRNAFRTLPADARRAIGDIEAAVARGVPVAVELQPTLNHHTVVKAVDDYSWRLFDSKGYNRSKGVHWAESIRVRGIASDPERYFVPRV